MTGNRAGTLILTGAMLLLARVGQAQVVLPPSIIQKQAEHENKAQQSASDSSGNPHSNPRKDQHQQIEALRTAALSDDTGAATSALRTLRSMGEAARPALREVVGKLLARDRATIESSRTLPAAADVRQLSDQIAEERKAARDNIKKLAHDETLKIAHEHYDSLKQKWEKLHGAFAISDGISRALSRRSELLVMWRDLMPADKQYSDDSEVKLAGKAQRALGFTPAQLSSVPELGQGEAPAEAVLRDIWFYRICRRIAAYNASAEKFMTAPELENARVVNAYREYLGILPFELDPRLVVSARDHSQEMVTLKYFAHESPVPSNRTPWDRIGKTGYVGGSGENIAMGRTSGTETFLMWFDSPGHHQNMASAHSTALGVGKINAVWTQNMGGGPRLMLAPPEVRKAVLSNAKPAPKDE